MLNSFAHCLGSQRSVSDLAPDDFLRYRQRLVGKGLAGRTGLGVHALNRAMTVIKGMLKHAHELDLIDRPVKYGKAFHRPSATLRRQVRRASELENGKRMFTPAEVRSLVEAPPIPLRATVLLAVNGGLGNSDCARVASAARGSCPEEAIRRARADADTAAVTATSSAPCSRGRRCGPTRPDPRPSLDAICPASASGT